MKRKEVARFGKKAVAFALAAAMIAQPATGIPFYSAVVVNAEEPGTTADEGVNTLILTRFHRAMTLMVKQMCRCSTAGPKRRSQEATGILAGEQIQSGVFS